jgi:hypothetical protein
MEGVPFESKGLVGMKKFNKNESYFLF